MSPPCSGLRPSASLGLPSDSVMAQSTRDHGAFPTGRRQPGIGRPPEPTPVQQARHHPGIGRVPTPPVVVVHGTRLRRRGTPRGAIDFQLAGTWRHRQAILRPRPTLPLRVPCPEIRHLQDQPPSIPGKRTANPVDRRAGADLRAGSGSPADGPRSRWASSAPFSRSSRPHPSCSSPRGASREDRSGSIDAFSRIEDSVR